MCRDCSWQHRVGVYHFINECTHPGLVAFRTRLRRSALTLVVELLQKAAAAVESEAAAVERRPHGTRDEPHRAYVERLHARLVELLEVLSPHVDAVLAGGWVVDNWTRASMRAAVYRILIAVPFSQRSLHPGSLPLVLLLGAVFDALQLPSRLLRPLCTMWVLFSARHLRELARLVQQLAARPGAPVEPPLLR